MSKDVFRNSGISENADGDRFEPSRQHAPLVNVGQGSSRNRLYPGDVVKARAFYNAPAERPPHAADAPDPDPATAEGRRAISATVTLVVIIAFAVGFLSACCGIALFSPR